MHTHKNIFDSEFCNLCREALSQFAELPPKRVQNIGKHGIYYARGRDNG